MECIDRAACAALGLPSYLIWGTKIDDFYFSQIRLKFK